MARPKKADLEFDRLVDELAELLASATDEGIDSVSRGELLKKSQYTWDKMVKLKEQSDGKAEES